MDQFSKDFGGLHSPDDFDLLSLGLVPGQEEQAETADQDEPRINPLHDMDSLEFLLWVEQEAEREMARRKGQAAEPAPAQSPEKNRHGLNRPCRFLFLLRDDYYSLFTNSARMALSTARIITPTSANMASHMLAIPRAPRIRHSPLMPRAKAMFS